MADDTSNIKHETSLEAEGTLVRDGVDAAERARALHKLATADPEPERADGTLTGPAHEAKYGLERADDSAARWRAVGVHPIENRALLPGEDGAENLSGAALADDAGGILADDSGSKGSSSSTSSTSSATSA